MTPSKKPERYCDSMEVTLFNRGWNAAIDATTPPAQPAPVQEPLSMDAIYGAWRGAGVDIAGGNWSRFVGMLPYFIDNQPAAQRPWFGLTDEEMYLNCPNWLSHEQCKTWVQQIEAKLKEKNT
jgi:hypothetical protein